MRKACLNSVYELAKKDQRVIFIGSDLGPGVLDNFKKNFPNRFYMEGIAEQNIIGMSAGLAFDGFLPYVNTISTFLTRRCYEQILIDIGLHNLPVRLIGNGGGLVYAPLGPTHIAFEDVSILKLIPNMTILIPCDAIEMRELMYQTLDWQGPVYIRLAKGGDEIITNEANTEIEIGKCIIKRNIEKSIFISTGVMTQLAIKASDELRKEKINIGVVHIHTINSIYNEHFLNLISNVENIVTVEEHYRNGGLGSAILELINDKKLKNVKNIIRFGLPNKFPDKYGNQEALFNYYGLNVPNLVASMKKN